MSTTTSVVCVCVCVFLEVSKLFFHKVPICIGLLTIYSFLPFYIYSIPFFAYLISGTHDNYLKTSVLNSGNTSE